MTAYKIRQGMTMQEVVDVLSDVYSWSDSVSNLSNKLQRESLRKGPISTSRLCMTSAGTVDFLAFP